MGVSSPTVVASQDLIIANERMNKGMLGYLTNMEETFLKEYEQGKREAEEALHKLDELSKGWKDKNVIEELKIIKETMAGFTVLPEQLFEKRRSKENDVAGNYLLKNVSPLMNGINRSIHNLVEYEEDMIRSDAGNDIVLALSELQAGLDTIEQGIKGYLIKIDNVFLEQYKKGLEKADNAYVSLLDLMEYIEDEDRLSLAEKIGEIKDRFKEHIEKLYESSESDGDNSAA